MCLKMELCLFKDLPDCFVFIDTYCLVLGYVCVDVAFSYHKIIWIV